MAQPPDFDRPFEEFHAAIDLKTDGYHDAAIFQLSDILLYNNNLLPLLQASVLLLLVSYLMETNSEQDKIVVHSFATICLEITEERLLDGLSLEDMRNDEILFLLPVMCDGLGYIRDGWKDYIAEHSSATVDLDQAVGANAQSFATTPAMGESLTSTPTFRQPTLSASSRPRSPEIVWVEGKPKFPCTFVGDNGRCQRLCANHSGLQAHLDSHARGKRKFGLCNINTL